MDAMARALLNAADIFIPEMLHTCYASFDSGAGKEFEEGKLNLEYPIVSTSSVRYSPYRSATYPRRSRASRAARYAAVS